MIGRRTAVIDGVRSAVRTVPGALLGCALVALGMATPVHAIVNGAAASDGTFAARFPWAVVLVDPTSGGICTAQLISPTWVLTAAHCTSEQIEVRMGNASRSLSKAVPVIEAIRHPRYDAATGEYRVGLIRLAAAPCGGDSGGPLLLTRADGTLVLAGVASRVVGTLCAQGGGVGIYVDVSRVHDYAHVKDAPARTRN